MIPVNTFQPTLCTFVVTIVTIPNVFLINIMINI